MNCRTIKLHFAISGWQYHKLYQPFLEFTGEGQSCLKGNDLSLRNTAFKPSVAVMSELRSLGILRYRGRRAGAGKLEGFNALPKKIAAVKQRIRQIDRRNLVRISCVEPTGSRTPTDFAVPKCLFTNICGLAKTKNRVKAHLLRSRLTLENMTLMCVLCPNRIS